MRFRPPWSVAPPPPPVNIPWQRGPNGAEPRPPKRSSKQKLGTARLRVNRGSERLHRYIKSAFVAAIEVMVLMAVASLFGRFMYVLYQGASVGQASIQAIVALVAVAIWLVRARERAKEEGRRLTNYERGHEHRGVGTNTEVIERGDPRLGGAVDPGAQTTVDGADDFTTRWDHHGDWPR